MAAMNEEYTNDIFLPSIKIFQSRHSFGMGFIGEAARWTPTRYERITDRVRCWVRRILKVNLPENSEGIWR